MKFGGYYHETRLDVAKSNLQIGNMSQSSLFRLAYEEQGKFRKEEELQEGIEKGKLKFIRGRYKNGMDKWGFIILLLFHHSENYGLILPTLDLISEGHSRGKNLSISICAVLISQAYNRYFKFITGKISNKSD